MNSQLLKELLDKYVMETITPEEAEQLFRMIGQEGHRQEVEQFIDSYLHGGDDVGPGSPDLREEIQGRLRASIREERQSPGRVIFFNWKRASVAAAVLVVAFTGVFLFYKNTPHTVQPTAQVETRFKNDVAPGGNKAILTLANGKKVVLDSAANGFIVQQGSARIVKLDNGQLAYNTSDAPAKEVAYNTLSTPVGGQYQLLLPDGTKVWLDAASSITYPSVFTGRERKVDITGQAYMEVAKNDDQPFIVQKGKMQVQVLGTHFNVNAYEDEASIKTTLVEGAVKVTDGNGALLLRPGQQAQLSREGDLFLSEKVDVSAVLAWKTGMFQFNATDIGTVMRQLARWYDLSVQYEGGPVKQTIYGTIPRTVSVASVFKVLEEAGGVHFRIEGKKVVVMP